MRVCSKLNVHKLDKGRIRSFNIGFVCVSLIKS